MCRDSDGVSPNAGDTSDSEDGDRTLRRKHDIAELTTTSRFTTTGPQGATQTSTIRSLTTEDGQSQRTIAYIHTSVLIQTTWPM